MKITDTTKVKGELHKKDGTIEVVEVEAKMVRNNVGCYTLKIIKPTEIKGNDKSLQFKLEVYP